jgi:hypothetical protein
MGKPDGGVPDDRPVACRGGPVAQPHPGVPDRAVALAGGALQSRADLFELRADGDRAPRAMARELARGTALGAMSALGVLGL